MIIKTLPVGPIQTNCYVIGCPDTLEGAVIDPGWDAETILAEADASRFLPRAYFPDYTEKELEEVSLGEVTFVDFLQAFLQCISHWEDVVHQVEANKINLDDMIARIIKRIGDAEKVSWRDLIAETSNRIERILVLLALLEMSRQQQITLRQARAYGNLWVMPSENHEFQRAS